MPQRHYFYTPILIENHEIGATDLNGDYTTSSACSPGAVNPSDPSGPIEVIVAVGMMCLRADNNNSRCVVSLPQSTNHAHIQGDEIDLGSLLGGQTQDWQQVSKSQIQSEYQNNDPAADDAHIDFTVEEE